MELQEVISPSRKRISPIESAVAGEFDSLLSNLGVRTVCRSAECPNRVDCFSRGSVAFMIAGDTCTRRCGFCAVRKGTPRAPDPAEPTRLARAVEILRLNYVVLTSATRDDLDDGGASHFANAIRELKALPKKIDVEVLVPDFRGDSEAVRAVVGARPEIFNHNVETVPRLYRTVRPGAEYDRSLKVLEAAKSSSSGVVTKSGLMVGMGEKKGEVLGVMKDLVDTGCGILTVGQYLAPSRSHVPVRRLWREEEFAELAREGRRMGFRRVACGFFVRSSYRASEALLLAVVGSEGPRSASGRIRFREGAAEKNSGLRGAGH